MIQNNSKSVKRIWVLTIMCGMSLRLFAQVEDRTGNWLMYFGANRVSDKISIHSEIQHRNHTIEPTNIEQLLLRTGLNYHFSSQAFATIGYGYIASHEFESEQSSPETREHRIWQQFISISNLGSLKFEHRIRTEQRWVSGEYRNRLRYRLMVFVPLNKSKIETGTIFLGVYDEIFLNTKNDVFDRNRLYGSLGYQFHNTANVQAGILHQKANDFGKWYLQLALVHNMDFRKEKNQP